MPTHVIPILVPLRYGNPYCENCRDTLAPGMLVAWWRVGKHRRRTVLWWTIRGVLVALGRVLGSAEREGRINANPVRRLERTERPKVKRTEFPPLDLDAIGRLIEHSPEPYKVLIALSVLTGLRQGEALGLQWQDVDVKAGTIAVLRQLDRQGKLVALKTHAARREVPIPPSLGRMLTAHKADAFRLGRARPMDLVFTSQTGGPMGYRAIVRPRPRQGSRSRRASSPPLARPPPPGGVDADR
jgi:integrase